MDELIELAIEAGFDTFSPNSIDDDIVICTYCASSINEKLVKFAALIEAKQSDTIKDLLAENKELKAIVDSLNCDF